MRIVHLSDAHLGYREYNRLTPHGMNAREMDVLNAFRQALTKVIEINPNLVLIAGDLFHSVRPSNLAIYYSFKEFNRLSAALTAPIIIIGGNHDSPRSRDTGCILDLLSNVDRVHVIHAESRVLRFPELDTSVFCLPHAALPFKSELRIVPDPDSKYNIFIAHARQEDEKMGFDRYELTRSDVHDEDWDYVAYGHYHTFMDLWPGDPKIRAYHSGSLEYAGGLTVWEQLKKEKEKTVNGHFVLGKGFIEYDLDKRELLFHELEPEREILDLPHLDADGKTAGEVDEMIQKRLASVPGGLRDKIIRLIVENVRPDLRRDLDYSALRQQHADALHFFLELRKPEAANRSSTGDYEGVTKPLEQEWKDMVNHADIPACVERECLSRLGLDYLASVTSLEDS